MARARKEKDVGWKLVAAAVAALAANAALAGEAPGPSPTQAFVQAVESASATPEQRAEAWKKLTEGDKKPPKAVVEAVDKARERAWSKLSALIGTLGAKKPVSALRSAATSNQAKVRDLVNGAAFSKEKLDEAMAPIQKALEGAMAALDEAEKFKTLRASINETETYAVGCGLRIGWNEELLDTLVTLALVSRHVGGVRSGQVVETNQLVGGWIDPGEAACVARLNVHRILLGLAPLEIDLRLVVAAKKHSEEMVAKNYFAHESPTEGLKTPWQRAGRERTAASGECCATGRNSGVGAFTGWYYSQPHHKIMISGAACVGVGHHGDKWTLMVGGSRMANPRGDRMAGYARRRYEAGEKPEALFDLAKWCASNQLFAQAQDELERLLALQPDHEAAKKALDRLRTRKP